jgi:hypothetical protein
LIECELQHFVAFSDKAGLLYDLSSLSLSDDNYEVQASGTSKFLLNVCRSVVRQIDYDCPYHAAVCAASIDPATSQKWTFRNIGQVNQVNTGLNRFSVLFQNSN